MGMFATHVGKDNRSPAFDTDRGIIADAKAIAGLNHGGEEVLN
jgi:hypothetical protein